MAFFYLSLMWNDWNCGREIVVRANTRRKKRIEGKKRFWNVPIKKLAAAFTGSRQAKIQMRFYFLYFTQPCVINLRWCLHENYELAKAWLTVPIKAVRTNLSGLVLYYRRPLTGDTFLPFITSLTSALNYPLTSRKCNTPVAWGELVVLVSHQSGWQPPRQKRAGL